MDFSKINSVARTVGYLPTKKLGDLETNKVYKISEIKWVKTQLGQQVVVGVNNEWNTYLPNRLVKFLQDDPEQFSQLVAAIPENHLHMRYIGGRFHDCEFIYQ